MVRMLNSLKAYLKLMKHTKVSWPERVMLCALAGVLLSVWGWLPNWQAISKPFMSKPHANTSVDAILGDLA
ncbi:MAG: hypothetical protein VKJ06_00815 [Vampirovibrionales bacterium]|nr:hypothetical protein [Vampirovibrionales bacterium]